MNDQWTPEQIAAFYKPSAEPPENCTCGKKDVLYSAFHDIGCAFRMNGEGMARRSASASEGQ